MKYFINENQINNFILNTVNNMGYDHMICEFRIDEEMDENNYTWIYAVISEEWLLDTNRNRALNEIGKMVDTIQKLFLNDYALKVRVGTYVKKCNK